MKNKKAERSVRTDMYTMGRKLAGAIEKNRLDIKEIKETMLTKQDGQRIIAHIDALTHRIETYDRKALVYDHRLNDHESRTTRIEHSA